jgi:hypothetical protein
MVPAVGPGWRWRLWFGGRGGGVERGTDGGVAVENGQRGSSCGVRGTGGGAGGGGGGARVQQRIGREKIGAR